MGLLGDYLPDFLPEDQNKRQAAQMGLLNFGAAMLANANRGFGGALGNGLLAGAQGYQSARDDQFQQLLRKSQMDELASKTAQRKSQQDAIGRISAGYQADPSFKPSMADLLAVDPDSAIKGMLPAGAVDFGLEPKIGLNPNTNKPGYFIQDKRGNTKWIDAGVPPNLQLIPGNDYQGPQVFDKIGNTLTPAGAAPAATRQPSVGVVGAPQSSSTTAPISPQIPEVDPMAPWAKLTSPKQQDEMRARVYEQDRKRLDELASQVTQGRSIMRDLDRFGELNRKQATGGALDGFSWMPTVDSDKREMLAIQSKLAPNMRPPGSGTTSDRDLALYLQALPSIDKPGNVNKAIRDQYAQQVKDAEDRYGFSQQYLVDKGHLNGVDDAYTQAKERANSGGLDLSKLTGEQIAYLQQTDPEAFNRGLERFKRNGGQSSSSVKTAGKVVDFGSLK